MKNFASLALSALSWMTNVIPPDDSGIPRLQEITFSEEIPACVPSPAYDIAPQKALTLDELMPAELAQSLVELLSQTSNISFSFKEKESVDQLFSEGHTVDILTLFLHERRTQLASYPLAPDMSTPLHEPPTSILNRLLSSTEPRGTQKNPLIPVVARYQNPHDTVYKFVGDCHGDISTLALRLLAWQKEGLLDASHIFKIADSQKATLRIVFTGDFMDRGRYGLECFMMALLLWLHNPDNIILTRGNHEDLGMNACTTEGPYGLENELMEKYPQTYDTILHLCGQIYDTMPVAAYIGTSVPHASSAWSYILACHGCADVNYDPQVIFSLPDAPVLLDIYRFNSLDFLKKLWNVRCHNNTCKSLSFTPKAEMLLSLRQRFSLQAVGFCWNDIEPNPCIKPIDTDRSGRMRLSHRAFISLCMACCHTTAIPTNQPPFALWKGAVRAHQHGDATLYKLFFGGSSPMGLLHSAGPWFDKTPLTINEWYKFPFGQVITLPVGYDSEFGHIALKQEVNWKQLTLIEDFSLKGSSGEWYYSTKAIPHTLLEEKLTPFFL